MRLVLLLAALLLTTATSERSPYYPRFAPEHSGTVYLHNASLRSVDAHVALLRPDAKVDCEAVLAGSPDRLSARDFLLRRKWTMRTGENVPLWSPQEGEQRACHVVLVRIDRRTWAVTWRDGTPALHPFPHESRPGTPPTDGGIRAMSNGAVWMLTPPDGVVAIQLDERQHESLVTEPSSLREPGAVSMTTYVSAASIADDDAIGDSSYTVAYGMRLRNVIGWPFGYATGTDFDIGSTDTGGLLYSFNLQPVGVGLSGGRYSVALTAGGGLSGITGERAGFALQVPVEAFVAVDVTRRVRIGVWGRSQWIFAEDPRQDGAPSAPFGDELQAGLTIDWLFPRSFQTAQPAVSLMFTYTEMLGTEMFGLAIGATFHDRSVTGAH